MRKNDFFYPSFAWLNTCSSSSFHLGWSTTGQQFPWSPPTAGQARWSPTPRAPRSQCSPHWSSPSTPHRPQLRVGSHCGRHPASHKVFKLNQRKTFPNFAKDLAHLHLGETRLFGRRKCCSARGPQNLAVVPLQESITLSLFSLQSCTYDYTNTPYSLRDQSDIICERMSSFSLSFQDLTHIFRTLVTSPRNHYTFTFCLHFCASVYVFASGSEVSLSALIFWICKEAYLSSTLADMTFSRSECDNTRLWRICTEK